MALPGGHPKAVAATVDLLHSAIEADEPAGWLSAWLGRLIAGVAADYAAVVSAAAGRWAAVAEAGTARSLPIEMLAEVLDRQTPATSGPWTIAAMGPSTTAVEVLAVHWPTPAIPAGLGPAIAQMAPLLDKVLGSVRQRFAHRERIRRLETLLDIASQWNQVRELEPLLVQMAEAATRLLRADRASIFLWDRPNRCLVGRPALGIKEGELRIPDDRGVVGEVVRSGRPRRVDAAAEPNVIDRHVDARLHYQTRTLLCVPLRGRSLERGRPGELFGAFELINRLSGAFTQEDEDALVEVAAHAAVALENAQDRQRLLSTNRQIADEAAAGVGLIGQSPAIEALRSVVRRVADTDLAVLVLGENGTGKEVVAQSIHYLSRRRGQPLVAVNCAGIPENLAESELFGHEKGAFTDAQQARQGKFELASGGTLFLDEIGDLSLSGQAKLLRVLEERVIVRVGGSTPIPTDARLLAASNQDLAEMVRQKRFREDLYFRLNVVTLEVPPLRDRPGDILLLAEHFLGDFCKRARRKVPAITPAARNKLTEHPWPGNVRELRNLMERLAYLSPENRIDAEDLAFILSPRAKDSPVGNLDHPLSEATARFQTDYIRRMVEQSGGNLTRAADRLGLHRSNLYRKMRQLGMEPKNEG
jgi:Nif-specific regulatory protein